jgi:CTP:molybdopterin cytidylyltransferase MocA
VRRRGRAVVHWAAKAALDAAIGPTWVVAGSTQLAGSLPEGVTILDNPRWPEGQATSLQVAVARARAEGLSAIVVGLGDQPSIPAAAWRAVAGSDAPLAVATYEGRRRNPVRIGEEVWDLLPESGDEGARALMRRRPDLVGEVACSGDPLDIDTVEDLARWS